jgi:alkylation response protein AidB-like acyl-CoA dehydrogenase
MANLVAAGAVPSTEDLDRAAAGLSALARELAPAIEANRRLPDELLEGLRGSGLLRAGAPKAVGAPEAPPAVTLRCAETVARGDASAGWCISVAATSSLLAGWLPADGAAEAFGDPEKVAAGVWAPRGSARRVEGGYRVSGRWAFCSGIVHSDYLFGGCMLEEEGGAPTIRVLGMPTGELQIIDTWHTSGLRGTGSHDAAAADLFVPEHRSLSLLGPPTSDAALYRFPVFAFFALSIAAAALGNARGAIDDLAVLAAGKVGQGSGRTLAQRPATWSAVAQAEASLRAARAFYYQAIDQAWAAAQSSAEPVSVELRTGLRLAATHAVRTAADVAREMYDLGGGSAIYDTSPLQRRFRDAHTATAHFQVNPATWELTGRLLLDQPTETAML